MLSNSSILSATLLLPVLGGLSILLIPPAHAKQARLTAIVTTALTLGLAVLAAWRFNWNVVSDVDGDVSVQFAANVPLIRSIGFHYFVGVDGLSLPLLLLTIAISLLVVWGSYTISSFVKTYYALLLFLIASLIGLFISFDLLLFFLFLELTILLIFLLITIWGGAGRQFAAIKFLLYALLGSGAILAAMIGIHGHSLGTDGVPTFDLLRLATDPLIKSRFVYGAGGAHFGQVAFWLIFAGFSAFIPAIPLHSWLPDVHAEAPTPIAILLSAILANAGAYGLLRIAYPLFPQQAADAWFYVAGLGVVSLLYGALVSLAQRDFKRLVAYSSVSQMGYVLLGIAVVHPVATQGVLFQMIAQGISAALFVFLAAILANRARHTDIRRFGGLWSQMPAYSGWAAIGFFSILGLPTLCGFVGQLLILFGVFSAADPASYLMRHTSGAAYVPLVWCGCLAAVATIFTAAYLLWTLQRVYMGAPKPEHQNFAGLTSSEKWILASLALSAFVLGTAPALLLEHVRPAIDGLMKLLSS
ncbi:MAG TPA: NADH-quinone oxidoreductase subunit M [Phycisphaerae bacterium]|nr:NADH-quinone oxidoreductase subunit M [Phycisphaerae bacterium]